MASASTLSWLKAASITTISAFRRLGLLDVTLLFSGGLFYYSVENAYLNSISG